MPPRVRYATKDGAHIGYQVFGAGDHDLVFITNWGTNQDALWEEPSRARFFERLGTFARVLTYDRRGTGISDPVSIDGLPTLEDWMEDVQVVMNAAGMERAAIIGDTEGGPMAMLFAATHPERVASLVLLNTFARFVRERDYRVGILPSMVARYIAGYEQAWGTGALVELTAPSVARDKAFMERFGRYERLSMPPGVATRMYEWVLKVDVRAVLPNIQAPTLVLHRRDNRHYRIAYGRYLAEAIPGARLAEVAGADCYPFHAGDADPVLREIHAFVTGASGVPWVDRQLATVLFTDIVASTEQAARRGDVDWLDLRDAHDTVVRRELAHHQGIEVDTTGDGFLATFDGPARAIRCAAAIVSAVRELGLEVRAGLHTGEVERRDGGIGGIAVHIASRVLDAASSGILVSGTVHDLVVGSGIRFSFEGSRRLKGVPGEWPLYAVTGLS